MTLLKKHVREQRIGISASGSDDPDDEPDSRWLTESENKDILLNASGDETIEIFPDGKDTKEFQEDR